MEKSLDKSIGDIQMDMMEDVSSVSSCHMLIHPISTIYIRLAKPILDASHFGILSVKKNQLNTYYFKSYLLVNIWES
jgi:hypothetical protein